MDIKKMSIKVPSKDTMLFISNAILSLNLNPSISKSKIIDKIDLAYASNDNIYKLIELLSNDAYKKLETIYKSFIEEKDVIDSFENNFSDELIDVCLFRETDLTYTNGEKTFTYTYNKNVFKLLNKLFDEKGKKLEEEDYLFELVVKGILNTYGIIKKEYFLTFVNDYLKKDYDYNTLIDKIYTKLILNTKVERFTINWKNINESDDFISKIPYTDDLGNLAESQKQLNFDYNYHDLDYIIKKANMNIENDYKDIIDNISNLNKSIDKKTIVNFIDEVITGVKSATDIIKPVVDGTDSDLVEDLIDYLTYIHNELELYPLCGYSPNSLHENKIVN